MPVDTRATTIVDGSPEDAVRFIGCQRRGLGVGKMEDHNDPFAWIKQA